MTEIEALILQKAWPIPFILLLTRSTYDGLTSNLRYEDRPVADSG